MWRVFYDETTGRIKYMVNDAGITGNEQWAYVDFPTKPIIDGKKVNIETKELTIQDAAPQIVFPKVQLTRRVSTTGTTQG